MTQPDEIRIETEADYDIALMGVAQLIECDPDSPEEEELNALLKAIEAWGTQPMPPQPLT